MSTLLDDFRAFLRDAGEAGYGDDELAAALAHAPEPRRYSADAPGAGTAPPAPAVPTPVSSAATATVVSPHPGRHPGSLQPHEFLKASEYDAALRANYFDAAGNKIASSREKPAAHPEVPLHSWRIDDGWRGIHGRHIDQLRELDPHSIILPEGDYTDPKYNPEGRRWDAERYADWIRQGIRPPPVEALETQDGKVRLINGHRRVAAAKMAGVPVRAWVNPAALSGNHDFAGDPIYTGLTDELARADYESRSAPGRSRRPGAPARYAFDPDEARDESGQWTASLGHSSAATATDDAPDAEADPESNLSGWSSRAASLPVAVARKARDFAVSTFRKFEARYGRKAAVAMMAGAVALLPVPVPGVSLLGPVAVAEGILAVRKLLRGPTPAPAEAYAREDEPDQAVIDEAARALVAELYRLAGEEPPWEQAEGDGNGDDSAVPHAREVTPERYAAPMPPGSASVPAVAPGAAPAPQPLPVATEAPAPPQAVPAFAAAPKPHREAARRLLDPAVPWHQLPPEEHAAARADLHRGGARHAWQLLEQLAGGPARTLPPLPPAHAGVEALPPPARQKALETSAANIRGHLASGEYARRGWTPEQIAQAERDAGVLEAHAARLRPPPVSGAPRGYEHVTDPREADEYAGIMERNLADGKYPAFSRGDVAALAARLRDHADFLRQPGAHAELARAAARRAVLGHLKERPAGREEALGPHNRGRAAALDDYRVPPDRKAELRDVLAHLPKVKGVSGGYYLPAGVDAEAALARDYGAAFHPLSPAHVDRAAAAVSPQAQFRRPLPGFEEAKRLAVKDRPARGGTSDASLLTLRDGRRVVLKARHPSEANADPYAEEAATGALRLMGFPNVPSAQAEHGPAGDPRLVMHQVPGRPLADAWERGTDAGREAIRAQNPPAHLADWLTASWLLSLEDRHEGNYHVGDDGTVYPIDFGSSLAPYPGAAMWGANHDMLLGYGLVAPTQPLNRAFLQKLRALRGSIADTIQGALPKDLPPAATALNPAVYQAWRAKALETLDAKFDALDRLLAHPAPTLADLKEPKGSQRLPYTNPGRFAVKGRGAAWVHGGEPGGYAYARQVDPWRYALGVPAVPRLPAVPQAPAAAPPVAPAPRWQPGSAVAKPHAAVALALAHPGENWHRKPAAHLAAANEALAGARTPEVWQVLHQVGRAHVAAPQNPSLQAAHRLLLNHLGTRDVPTYPAPPTAPAHAVDTGRTPFHLQAPLREALRRLPSVEGKPGAVASPPGVDLATALGPSGATVSPWTGHGQPPSALPAAHEAPAHEGREVAGVPAGVQHAYDKRLLAHLREHLAGLPEGPARDELSGLLSDGTMLTGEGFAAFALRRLEALGLDESRVDPGAYLDELWKSMLSPHDARGNPRQHLFSGGWGRGDLETFFRSRAAFLAKSVKSDPSGYPRLQPGYEPGRGREATSIEAYTDEGQGRPREEKLVAPTTSAHANVFSMPLSAQEHADVRQQLAARQIPGGASLARVYDDLAAGVSPLAHAQEFGHETARAAHREVFDALARARGQPEAAGRTGAHVLGQDLTSAEHAAVVTALGQLEVSDPGLPLLKVYDSMRKGRSAAQQEYNFGAAAVRRARNVIGETLSSYLGAESLQASRIHRSEAQRALQAAAGRGTTGTQEHRFATVLKAFGGKDVATDPGGEPYFVPSRLPRNITHHAVWGPRDPETGKSGYHDTLDEMVREGALRTEPGALKGSVRYYPGERFAEWQERTRGVQPGSQTRLGDDDERLARVMAAHIARRLGDSPQIRKTLALEPFRRGAWDKRQKGGKESNRDRILRSLVDQGVFRWVEGEPQRLHTGGVKRIFDLAPGPHFKSYVSGGSPAPLPVATEVV